MKNKALSRDGFIIDQRELGDEPYGACASDYNGCGWIALFNFLRLIGRPLPPDAIKKALLSRSLLSGRLGTSPFAVQRFLKSSGIPARFAAGKKKAVRASLSARAGVLFYLHSRGLHYVAFASDGDTLRFFNAISGKEDHRTDMAGFLKAHALPLLVCCWTLKRDAASE